MRRPMIFGPGGRLFVPITGGGDGTSGSGDAGEIRSYDVTHHPYTYEVFSQSLAGGGNLQVPSFATFCNTDPATLAYDESDPTGRCITHQ